MSKIVENPGILDQEDDNTDDHGSQKENVDGLKLQLQKLKHGMERLIDSLAAGVIERDQFTARMDRTKSRIAEIEAKLGAQETDEGRRAHVQALIRRLGEIPSHIKSQLRDPDWATRREIIRAIVQRIEIGPAKVTIVLRLPVDPAARAMEPIMRTLSRGEITGERQVVEKSFAMASTGANTPETMFLPVLRPLAISEPTACTLRAWRFEHAANETSVAFLTDGGARSHSGCSANTGRNPRPQSMPWYRIVS